MRKDVAPSKKQGCGRFWVRRVCFVHLKSQYSSTERIQASNTCVDKGFLLNACYSALRSKTARFHVHTQSNKERCTRNFNRLSFQ